MHESKNAARDKVSNTTCIVCRSLPVMLCTIWYLWKKNKKREKNPWRSVTFIKVACNFTKNKTPPWVFSTFLTLHKWYQIVLNVSCFDRHLVSIHQILVKTTCQTQCPCPLSTSLAPWCMRLACGKCILLFLCVITNAQIIFLDQTLK